MKFYQIKWELESSRFNLSGLSNIFIRSSSYKKRNLAVPDYLIIQEMIVSKYADVNKYAELKSFQIISIREISAAEYRNNEENRL